MQIIVAIAFIFFCIICIIASGKPVTDGQQIMIAILCSAVYLGHIIEKKRN